MARAVVIRGAGGMDVCDLAVAGPREGEVRVRMRAAGVCHSDLNVLNRSGTGMFLPAVLGHEGSGVVEDVGPGVGDLEPGDHVILAVVAQCGHCLYCTSGQPTLCEQGHFGRGALLRDGTTRLTFDGQPVGQMAGLGTWCEEAVVAADVAIKVDPSMPFPQAAILGCGVVTGYGAAVNAGHVGPGETVAVIGCGGVGLSGLQGARIAGAGRIIAIDVVEGKLDLATTMGATETLDATAVDDVVAEVLDRTGGHGADVVLDFVGSASTSAQAVAMTRNGGRCVFTGLAGSDWSISVTDFLRYGKTITGNYMGMGNFRKTFAELTTLYHQGRLQLDEMVSREIAVTEVAEAFRAMQAGEVARSVITKW